MEKQAQTLAKYSPKQLEQFLVELANLQDDVDAAKRFINRFAAFIPHDDEGLAAIKIEGVARRVSELGWTGETLWVITLKLMLNDIWTEPDSRQKEWEVFVFRYALYKWADRALTTDDLFKILSAPSKRFRVPPPTPFEQALTYLVKAGDRARYCANPECPAPYFFVKRKNQRYCSEICAAPAQRELKRKWWAKHGEEWRAARQDKGSSKGRASKGESSGRQKQTIKKGSKGRK